MRYVVLDTETTGLEVRQGHRIIEIGCIEMQGRQLTERHFHEYINPERAVDEGAFRVHGISDAMLADKPVFSAVASQFVSFIQDSTLIIHNASFDIGFLDAELTRLGLGQISTHVHGVIDSLQMAREMFPGKRNNLDALCDRLGVNNAHRQLHGALLDSQILAEVYLAMTRGQDSLMIDMHAGSVTARQEGPTLDALSLPEPEPTPDELAEHLAYLEGLDKASKGNCVWKKLDQAVLA